MAKTTLPNYVSAALVADRDAQSRTIASIALYVFAEVKADREVTELGARLFAAAPHRSLKTWQNYATTCMALGTSAHVCVKLEAFWSQCATGDVAEIAPAFQTWLTDELRKKGYHTSPEDVANFAKGRLSIKAQAKKDKADADAKKVADAAALAAQQAEAAKTVTPSEPVDNSPPASGEPTGILPNTDVPTEPQTVTGYEPAIQPARQTLVHAYVEGDGLQITLGETLTRADLIDILTALQAELDQMPAPLPEIEGLVLETESAAG